MLYTNGLLILAMSACGPSGPTREAKTERDLNTPPADSDTGDAVDTGAPDDAGTDYEPVIPSDEVVCYPGVDNTWTTCLPLVSWSSAWGDDYDYPEPLDDNPLYSAPLRFIDLNAPEAEADPPLAPNFMLSELMQPWKGRFALFQPTALAHVQAIRDSIAAPLTVNSGYRNITYNASVGGATWSRHLYGDATDMASSDASLDELGALCEGLGAGYVGYYDTHVHCDWREDPLEPAFYAEETSLQATNGVWSVLHAEGPEGPLRLQWRAEDAHGERLVTWTGPSFRPPHGSTRIRVDIGGLRTLAVQLAPSAAPQ